MDIVCEKCESKFVLPDERVPDAKKFRLSCPRCKESILVSLDDPGDTSSEKTDLAPEHFPHGTSVGFVFVEDATAQARIRSFLQKKEYMYSGAKDAAEAISKLRINHYQVMILEEGAYAEALLEIVRQWNGQRRRETSIILIGADCQSLRSDEAFLRGVNVVIGKNDAASLEKFLDMAFKEYAGYRELWDLAQERLQARSL